MSAKIFDSAKYLALSICVIGLVSACDSSEPETGLDDIVDINYQLHVQPIFNEKCTRCRLFDGAERGEVVIPYSSDNSVLIELATKWDNGSHPEEIGGDPLSQEEIRFLSRWIDEGAKSISGTVYGSDASNLLYVCNQGDATVSVIDMTTGQVIRVVDLVAAGFSAGANPHMVAVEPDGSAWYVSLIGDNKVVKFSRDNEVLGSADMETPGMVMRLNGSRKLYAARSFSASNPPTSIASINVDDMSLSLIDVVFERPHALIPDPGGSFVITASLNSDQIAVINTSTDQIDHIAGRADQSSVYVQGALNGEGDKLYMTGQISNTLSVFDLTDLSDIQLTATETTGDQPWHPVVTNDDNFVYFGNLLTHNIFFVDTQSNEVAGAIGGIGIAQPHGSTVSREGKIYISNRNVIERYIPRYNFGDNSDVGTVVEIDPSTNQVTRVIEVGKLATGIATAE